MGRFKMSVPYLRSTPSGFYWEPSRKLRAAGFAPEALGKNAVAAVSRARDLNLQAESQSPPSNRDPHHVAEGTIAWLIRQWQRSPGWGDLAPETRKSYGAAFKAIEVWCGHYEPRAVTRKAIKAWQRALERDRGQAIANVILLRLHRLMEMARDDGLLEYNPANKLRLRKVGGNQEPWPREDIETVRAQAISMGRPSIALAVLLAANLGQREADIIKLPRSRYDASAGVFDIVQQKTKTRIGVPATIELRAAIDGIPATSPVFVVSEETGRPYKATNFQHTFRRICRAAGLPDKRLFMNLRHTVATMLGEAGCTDDEIRAITGHLDRAVVARYLKPNTAMAKSAIAKLEQHRTR
jgi:integrase